MLKYLFLFVFVLFLTAGADAVQLEVLGGLNYSNPGSNDLTYTSSTITYTNSGAAGSFGGGMLLNFVLGKAVEFQLGALYVSRIFSYTSGSPFGSLVGNVASTYFEYPLVLRYRISHFAALGGGYYFANGTGNTTWNGSSGGTAFGNIQATNNSSENGFIVSLGLKFPIGKTTNFIIDADYVMSSTAASYPLGTVTPTPHNSVVTLNAQYNDLMTLVGLNFQL